MSRTPLTTCFGSQIQSIEVELANRIASQASGVGFDWDDAAKALDKVSEESAEIIAARDDHERREEFGDLLLVLVNMARKLGIDSEAALRSASAKFAARFAQVASIAVSITSSPMTALTVEIMPAGIEAACKIA